MPLFSPIVLSLSLSLSLSLRPPRILFPAVCPFRLSRHNFGLPSPELCILICHCPHPPCPLSAYPPRPNSCAPDIDFGAPTPPLMTWTPPIDVVDPNNFAPGPPPLMAPTSDIFRVAPSNLCSLTNHWYPGPQPLVCWPPAFGLLLPKHWSPGRQHCFPLPQPLASWTQTIGSLDPHRSLAFGEKGTRSGGKRSRIQGLVFP